MITKDYNPSEIEVRFARVLADLGNIIAGKMAPLKLENIEEDSNRDNPHVRFYFSDQEGDLHEVLCRVIQKPDSHN